MLKGDIVTDAMLKDPKWGTDTGLRDDIRLVGHARQLGWTVDLHGDANHIDPATGRLREYVDERGRVRPSCSGDSYSFKKGEDVVWYVGNWRRATVRDGRTVQSTNRAFGSLKEALEA